MIIIFNLIGLGIEERINEQELYYYIGKYNINNINFKTYTSAVFNKDDEIKFFVKKLTEGQRNRLIRFCDMYDIIIGGYIL